MIILGIGLIVVRKAKKKEVLASTAAAD